jgi:hypothetical protein
VDKVKDLVDKLRGKSPLYCLLTYQTLERGNISRYDGLLAPNMRTVYTQDISSLEMYVAQSKGDNQRVARTMLDSMKLSLDKWAVGEKNPAYTMAPFRLDTGVPGIWIHKDKLETYVEMLVSKTTPIVPGMPKKEVKHGADVLIKKEIQSFLNLGSANIKTFRLDGAYRAALLNGDTVVIRSVPMQFAVDK